MKNFEAVGKFNNIDNSGGLKYDFSVDGAFVSLFQAGVSYVADDILLAVVLVSYDAEPVLPPRLRLTLETGTDGFSNGVFNNYNKAGITYKDNTFVMFTFCKATNTNASSAMQALFYPYGLSPASGVATYKAAMFNLGQGMEGVLPFASPLLWNNSSVAPTAGTWINGDSLLNGGNVSAGGTTGWICTTAGTPGTWKTNGAIGA